MDPKTKVAMGQGAKCLGSMANELGSEQNPFFPFGFQGHGLFSSWLEAPWGYDDCDIGRDSDDCLANKLQNSENNESTFLSSLEDWFPDTGPNQLNDITESLTLDTSTDPFPQDLINETSYQPFFGSISPALLSNESSASSCSGTQSVETNMTTPYAPFSPELSPPKGDNKASTPTNQPKTSKKKERRKGTGIRKRDRNKVEKPFKCDLCNHATAEKRDLDRHLICRHPEEATAQGLSTEKIKCKYFPTCARTFARKDHHKRHLKNKHSG